MTEARWQLEAAEIAALVSGTHGDPFAKLGVHKAGSHYVARAVIPDAETVAAFTLDGTALGELEAGQGPGYFEGKVALKNQSPVFYDAKNATGQWTVVDPYSFGPILGPMDDYYVAQGTHLRLYDKLGAHAITHEGIAGVLFAVWAPNAKRVSVVGDFNRWDGRRHVMRHRKGAGLWEIFIPELEPKTVYKFEIIGAQDRLLPLKADPLAFQSEMRPKTASVIAAPEAFTWSDADYLKARAQKDHRRSPMTIYEVHLGSWKRHGDGRFFSYRELADDLLPYAADMGFTHIELLPVSEHPFDPSWGYQPTGLYAPTARFGSPRDFAYFMDRAHALGLGVILDWVPAHFPTDEHGLAHFDGTALYEHQDPRRGFHPDWNTAIYNFGRTEVSTFLINNALYWMERFHADGLRVDAVASMLYLDYSRKEGEWIPNPEGGRENQEAIAFLKRMNATAYGTHPGIVTVAEESTAWPGVSQPTHVGGLGFGFKWNMGFMHDTLRYMSHEPIHRKHHHNDLTFGLLYAFSENFVLPLSHDEVVHGKGSLLTKMAGDDWQKFANLRAYYAFMWAYPGKKLLFMGQEFAQRDEWSEARGLDWELLQYPSHGGVRSLVRDLNALYRALPQLHARDCEGDGFEWLIADDRDNSVFAWMRKSGGNHRPVVAVSNFTPVPRHDYVLPLPLAGHWRERINTDATNYGGSGQGNFGVIMGQEQGSHGQPASARVTLPPLATLILEHEG
ncbi:1,4-alpha-glucan branching protein GlgB [Taklimakanibacter deserti]|uniref:1,4-alpha-glucan branching protein GlgB n=1 Tax=Taklimakanibacter deserti TaxID=2267839 RepID=UPI000E64AA60